MVDFRHVVLVGSSSFMATRSRVELIFCWYLFRRKQRKYKECV